MFGLLILKIHKVDMFASEPAMAEMLCLVDPSVAV